MGACWLQADTSPMTTVIPGHQPVHRRGRRPGARSSPMQRGRWYPTNTTLASGDVVIMAGSDENGVVGSRARSLVEGNRAAPERRESLLPVLPPHVSWLRTAASSTPARSRRRDSSTPTARDPGPPPATACTALATMAPPSCTTRARSCTSAAAVPPIPPRSSTSAGAGHRRGSGPAPWCTSGGT